MIKNRKGGLEHDQLGKLLIGVAILVLLIIIVTVWIKGELDVQDQKVNGVFEILK